MEESALASGQHCCITVHTLCLVSSIECVRDASNIVLRSGIRLERECGHSVKFSVPSLETFSKFSLYYCHMSFKNVPYHYDFSTTVYEGRACVVTL